MTGFELNGINYYYKKNAQNDIIGIFDDSGTQIVEYNYDAWGNFSCRYLSNFVNWIEIEDFSCYNDISEINKFIALKNPFRYRSYYYDYETNLYYLNSRYYDPEIGRFINADDINILHQAKEFINGLNLYAYCNDNPVNSTDENGNAWWEWLIAAFIAVAVAVTVVAITVATGGSAIPLIAGAVIGASIGGISSAVTQLATGSFSWGQLGIDILFGAITGLIGGSALGAIGAGIAMGATGFASSMMSDLASSGSVNYVKASVLGLLSGLLGAQNGAQYGLTNKTLALQSSLNTVKTNIANGFYSLRSGNGALNLVKYHLNIAKSILINKSLINLFGSYINSNPVREFIWNYMLGKLFE